MTKKEIEKHNAEIIRQLDKIDDDIEIIEKQIGYHRHNKTKRELWQRTRDRLLNERRLVQETLLSTID